ncbi:MAG: 23S rRNA (adenine(2503)-C(2))-methyltransferase RlmN [Methylacidiphilales bacterium]|nr:23S rRNA (adenine(2503)-C(2))-methyltransferase RlmN [Candidatus Methylacidiphilales bacterium]
MKPLRPLLLDEAPEEWNLFGPDYRRQQVAEWLFRKRAGSIGEMSNLPTGVRQHLEAAYDFTALRPARVTGSADTTRKLLWELRSGDYVESVLIPASPDLFGERSDRFTLCLSTQVGCAYGCKFCASGLEGWKRNLTPGEIVAQILETERVTGKKINNLVFMGMGEPLANYENLMKALTIINASWGVGIGARHITISTSGLAPQIRELSEQPLQIRLALSLHGATDEVRQQIMPVNRKYPLTVLLEACADYQAKKRKMMTLEYILIEGVNDSAEQAAILAKHARRLHAKVNLIPYNTVEGLEWRRPSDFSIDRFAGVLTGARVTATVRREKGHDIDAACGQLRLKQLKVDRDELPEVSRIKG